MKNGDGEFYILDNGEKIAFMTLHISNEILTSFHLEAKPEYRDQHLGKEIFDEMVKYARTHELKVRPLCPYVHAQFKRHREEFDDLWLKVKS